MNGINAEAMTQIEAEVRSQAYPLVFVTISGAHLYGFPSADSAYDLRGVHLLPLEEVLGLKSGPETIELSNVRAGLLLETVTHDLKKFIRLLLQRNGYVLEQLYSPLVVHTTPEHEELKSLARSCITKKHALHYLGFAQNQWRLFQKKPTVKQILYLYRVLLTGIHLMKTGEIEANLPRLNDTVRLPQLSGLIERKVKGKESSSLEGEDIGYHEGEYGRLAGLLEEAASESRLPASPSAEPALNDLLIRLRLRSLDGAA